MTKKVNINRRRTAGAVFVAWLILGLNAGVGFAQDDAAKPQDSAKPADDTKTAKNAKNKDYGVIFGTAYGPNDHPMYGVHVTIRPVGKKHPSWELLSDHRGEFAQRVPPAPGDYLVTGEIEIVPLEKGKASKKMRLKGEAKVHIDGAEWHDFSLHLEE